MRRTIPLLLCLLALQCSPTKAPAPSPQPPTLNLDVWEQYSTVYHTPFPMGKDLVKLRLPSSHFGATATYNVTVNGVAPDGGT